MFNDYRTARCVIAGAMLAVVHSMTSFVAGHAQEVRSMRKAKPVGEAGSDTVDSRAAWLGFATAVGPSPVIALVAPGSPAAAAGLRAGDVLRRLGGVRATQSALDSMIERLRAGDTLRFEIRRGAQVQEVQLIAAAAVRLTPRSAMEGRSDADISDEELALCGARWLNHLLDDVAGGTGARKPLATDSLAAGARSAVSSEAEFARRCALLARSARDSGKQIAMPPARSVATRKPVAPPDGAGIDTVGGAVLQPITPALSSYFPETRMGLLVLRVSAGGPADRAGLRAGDVIVELSGRSLSSTFMLRQSIRENVKRDLPMSVVRSGQRRQIAWPAGAR